MLIGRAFMGCGIHEYEGKKYVLSIGGLWYGGTGVLPYIQAVESLELDSMNLQWKLGKFFVMTKTKRFLIIFVFRHIFASLLI